jgi:hypothetical protein
MFHCFIAVFKTDVSKCLLVKVYGYGLILAPIRGAFCIFNKIVSPAKVDVACVETYIMAVVSHHQ